MTNLERIRLPITLEWIKAERKPKRTLKLSKRKVALWIKGLCDGDHRDRIASLIDVRLLERTVKGL